MSEAALQDDPRPVVATGGQGNWGLYAFIAILLLGGVWLFSALNASREAAQAPATFPTAEYADGRITSPPPLGLPELRRELPPERDEEPLPLRRLPVPLGRSAPPSVPSAPVQPVERPEPLDPSDYMGPPPLAGTPQQSVVYEAESDQFVPQKRIGEGGGNRVLATRLDNPGYIVPQGTIIPAVLETAFNSTRPGGVRALVQRDVRGFDGRRVLVPRGSRLYGRYDAGIAPGEKRALITWTRLLRPDGVSIDLDSPASDPLGRAGVRGDVKSNFFARFGGALLQTVLDIGTGIAIGEATGGNSTILALPGSTQNIMGDQRRAQPVLEIDHGTSVTVYVSQDLDFSTVDS